MKVLNPECGDNIIEAMRESGHFDELKFKTEDFNAQYTTGKELGRGQFAVVKTCTHNDTDGVFAAKFVKKKRSSASRQGMSREAIAREASILSAVNHDKIIKLYEAYETRSEVILILELVSGGELFEEISEQEYLTEIEACYYTRQVLEAVEHLHKLCIIHLDIKPENIILKEKGRKQIKLVDFGLAQKLLPGKELREMMGTAEFVAPEIINYEALGSYTDMWAIGVLAYILLSGASPFLGDDNEETYRNILKLNYEFDEDYFSEIGEEARDFIEQLLVYKPSGRRTASDCLQHSWIKRSYMQPVRRTESVTISTAAFKAFVARRRWQRSFKKLKAISRLKLLAKAKETQSSDDSAKESAEESSPILQPKLPITTNLIKNHHRSSSFPNLTTNSVCCSESFCNTEDENGNRLDLVAKTLHFSQKKTVRISLSLNMADKATNKAKENPLNIPTYVPDPQPTKEAKASIETTACDLKKTTAAE